MTDRADETNALNIRTHKTDDRVIFTFYPVLLRAALFNEFQELGLVCCTVGRTRYTARCQNILPSRMEPNAAVKSSIDNAA